MHVKHTKKEHFINHELVRLKLFCNHFSQNLTKEKLTIYEKGDTDYSMQTVRFDSVSRIK